MNRKALILALSLFSCLAATAQTAKALSQQADSLYALQQYNDALSAAFSGLSRLTGGDSSADATYTDEETACDLISSSYNTLAGIYMSARQPQSEDMRQFLSRIISIADELMARGNISVNALASELCLSPAQLRSRIGELSGETPQNFILGIRMQKARHLLTTQPSMPIGTVALRCGYEEMASFSRAFKRYFGCPPSEFVAKQGE